MKIFCKVCGSKLKNHGIVGHDETTGKPIYDQRCSENPYHQGHDHETVRGESRGWWDIFPSYWFSKCRVCGDKQILHHGD